jgi:hypothetical protein
MAEQKTAHAEIDWSTAEVADARLTVALAGEPSGDWAKRVEAIIDRLQPSAGWAIEVSRKKLAVEPVAEGAEADVRHFLESVVQQANADFAPNQNDDAESGRSEEDTAMTETFRSFSGSEDGEEET